MVNDGDDYTTGFSFSYLLDVDSCEMMVECLLPWVKQLSVLVDGIIPHTLLLFHFTKTVLSAPNDKL